MFTPRADRRIDLGSSEGYELCSFGKKFQYRNRTRTLISKHLKAIYNKKKDLHKVTQRSILRIMYTIPHHNLLYQSLKNQKQILKVPQVPLYKFP